MKISQILSHLGLFANTSKIGISPAKQPCAAKANAVVPSAGGWQKSHAPAPAVKSSFRQIVIDGQNLLYGSPTNQKVSLLNVLALVMELNQRQTAFKCFFDANAFFTLIKAGKKDEAYAYRRLCHDYPDLFIEVPGRNRADDYLLDYANQGAAAIISNDQYRDFAAKYGWLNQQPGRRSSFLVHSGLLQITGLGLTAKIPSTLHRAEKTLREQLGAITGQFVPATYPPLLAPFVRKPSVRTLLPAAA